MPFVDDLNLSNSKAFKDDLGLMSSGFVDDLNLAKKPSRPFKEKAIEFLTAGHMYGTEGMPEAEVSFTPEGKMTRENVPTGDPGFFQDPVTFAAMAALQGARVGAQAVAPLATKLAKGVTAAVREGIGWMTGGVSDVPALAKAGIEAAPKAADYLAGKVAKVAGSKNLAKLATERAGKPFAEVPVQMVAQPAATSGGKQPWEMTTKAVDAQGAPITVYRKSDIQGDYGATEGKPIFFGSDKGMVGTFGGKTGKVYEAKLDIKKPYEADWNEIEYLNENPGEMAKLKAQGYDGIIEKSADQDSWQYIVFDKSQIKPTSPSPLPEAGAKAETLKERGDRIFQETQAKFAEEAANTESISAREARRKAEATVEPVDIKFKAAEMPGMGLSKLAAEQKQTDQAGKIIIELGKKEVKPSYSFAAPETEALFQSAKGIHPEGIIEKIKNVATEVGHKFAREFEHLARKTENAQLIFDLKRLEKQKDVVADRTVRSIGETLSGLSKTDYNIFSRKVILDDLMSDYTKGVYAGKEDLPFKFTPESLSAEIGKLDALIGTNPKVGEALAKRQGMWDQVKKEYVDALSPYKAGVKDMFKENYYRHQVLDYVLNNGIFGTGKRLRAPIAKGYTKGRTGYSGLYNTDYLEAEHQIMAQMLHDVETAKTLTKIQKGEDIAKEIRAQAKVDGLDDWHKAVPEGYRVWQPKEGNVFYPVLTVNEKTAERIMTGQMDEILEGGGKIFNDALAIGGKRKEWVVRDEVAETLDNLVRERAKGLLSSADLGVMTAWKKWQLISPRRFFKYNARNLTGDAEAVFLGNMSGFKKTPQAVRELGEVFFQKKSMSPDMAAWFERGGMSSTLQAQEMDALKPMWMFSRLHEKKAGDLNLWNKYWAGARIATDFRESILRYANFLDYKSQLTAGKGIPKNYGASKPEMINALKDIDDKAFWLSNDLLGAYDRIGVAGQTVRERVLPFWSFQEVNFKRYLQFYKNAANDGDLAATIGKQLGAKTAIAALKIGRLAIKTAAFASMLQVYNHTLFPEEEKILPTDMKSTPHIIFGRDDKGNIEYFNRMGTLDDFISWFGLDYAPRFIGEYLDGKKTMKELLQAQAKKTYEAPANKVVQGSMPFTKLLAETISRKSTFPDVFQPGTVRDRWYHIARSFGLENEYKLMAGKPSKGYGESLKNLFIYKIDPGEAAFRNVYDMKSDFMKKLGRTSEGFWLTPTGDALYNMKLSIKYDDKEAFSKYFTEYVTLAYAQGKTKEQIQQGIKTSIQTMHPLHGMNKQLENAFIGSLNYEDQGTLAQAIGFYNDILTGKPQKGID